MPWIMCAVIQMIQTFKFTVGFQHFSKDVIKIPKKPNSLYYCCCGVINFVDEYVSVVKRVSYMLTCFQSIASVII